MRLEMPLEAARRKKDAKSARLRPFASSRDTKLVVDGNNSVLKIVL
jgi:hypothetical protein